MDKYEEYRKLRNEDYVYRDLSPKLGFDYKKRLDEYTIEYTKYNTMDNYLLGYESSFDLDAVKNSLRNIFLVNKNEVPGKPRFGNPLMMELFDNFDEFNTETIKDNIKNEIQRYDDRIELVDIKVEQFYELNRLVVEIVYYVIIKDNKVKESIYLPFSHNDFTYISGREALTI
jgi:phage baseplate assembly protein W